MNLPTRILGVAILVSVFAGATYGAFQAFGTEAQVHSVDVQRPDRIPTLMAGQDAPVVLEIQNNGDADANVTMESASDGFSFRTDPAVTSVPAQNSSQASGLLGAEIGVEGEHNITLVARENETGDRLDSVSFNVTVQTPSPPEISLEPILPAVLPGEEARFQVRLENTVQAPQDVNLSLVDGAGSVDPQTVSLRPGGTGTATAIAPVPADAPGTYEVEVQATNDADQTASATQSVTVVSEGKLAAEPLASSFTVDPGNQYTVPVVVVSNADVSGNVTVAGADVVEDTFSSIESRSSVGGFVTLEVPEDAGEDATSSFRLQIADRTKRVEVSVSTQTDGEQPQQGQQVEAQRTSRLPGSGGVVETSHPGIAQGPFEKSTYFEDGQQATPMTIRLGGRAQRAPAGVVQAVENMTVGESVTVTLEPEDAYGPERHTQEMEATTEQPRVQPLPRLLEDLPRAQLPDQFDIDNRTEGEVIDFTQEVGDETIVLQFRLVKKGEEQVTLERVAEEGDTTTFYPPWPNATEVTNVNETTVEYTTTPPDSAYEEPFTWDLRPQSHKAQWGNTTLVDEVNETTIVLRHQPEEGLEYNTTSRFGQERSWRVENVTRETITLSTPNQDPRGGETVIFDLTVTDISEAQRRGLPPGLGGG